MSHEGLRLRDWNLREPINYLPKIEEVVFPPRYNLSPEEQKGVSKITRDLDRIGVISEFKKIITEGTIATDKEYNPRPHIEYGESAEAGKGLFLVFKDRTTSRRIHASFTNGCMIPPEGKEILTNQEEAIGVTKINGKYHIGCYSKRIDDTHLYSAFRKKTYTQWSPQTYDSENLVKRGKVLKTLRTVIDNFKHNQEEIRTR